MAAVGWRPIVYGIAPFVTERALEQIKLDVAYNARNVKIVSVGASYDYATAGPTHHCPADVATLYNVPGLRIYAPCCGREAGAILTEIMQDDAPAYVRLEDSEFDYLPQPIGRAIPILEGDEAVVVAIGPALEYTLEAADGYDVTLLYANTVTGVDWSACNGCPVLLVEPYYTTLANEIGQRARILRTVAPGREWRHEYGRKGNLLNASGLSIERIKAELEVLLWTASCNA
jgi:transketolase